MKKCDDPTLKERLMSALFGQFLGFLNAENLTKGKEFDTRIDEVFQCSKRFIWIDEFHPIYNITVHFNSIAMNIEYGVVEKASNTVTHRMKLEDLRYKISDGTELELIDSHQAKFDDLFNDFKNEFKKLKEVPANA